jgi:hypothetical protein
MKMTISISKRAEFLSHLERQDDELSEQLKKLEHDILRTYELREATRKLMEVMIRGMK